MKKGGGGGDAGRVAKMCVLLREREEFKGWLFVNTTTNPIWCGQERKIHGHSWQLFSF